MNYMIERRTFISGAAAAGAAALGLGSRLLFGEERTEAPCVRAGLVTDLHYADIPAKYNRYYRESSAKLGEAVATMNKVRPDFMVELGDFKDLAADKAQTLKCLDRIESVFARFSGDRFHVPGNHDFDCLTPGEFFSHVRNAGQDAALGHYSFVRGGITFIVLDACYTFELKHYSSEVDWDWKDSNVPPEQIEWLQAELKKAKVAVVFCHQRLDPKARAHHEVKNADKVREVLEKSGKVKSVLTGHDHIGGLCRLNGITYYTLRAMIEGSGVEQNSYAVASFYADGAMSIRGWRTAASL